MIRRIQLTLLALFVGVWAMASETSVKNADGVEIWYDFDSNTKTASVTYKGKSEYSNNDNYIGNVVIPSKVTYKGEEYSVTEIGWYAFADCSSLTSITIPESVTEIGRFAFSYCSSLTSITIPEGVTSIEVETFYGCSSLTSITIPESVTEIGSYAFDSCYRLYEVYNKSNLTITAGSFDNGYVAYYAKKVYTDDSGESKLKTVGDYIFYIDEDNIELLVYLGDETAITLPSDYEGKNYKIGDYAFYDCDYLTSITIPESVTKIGKGAFSHCSSLTSVTIPDGVTSIGESAFNECSSLTSITLPEGVTEIGDYAFSGCYRLYEVYNKSDLAITAGSSKNGRVAFYAKNVYTDESEESKLKTVGDYIFYVDEDNIELLVYLGDETAITLPSDYEGKDYIIANYAFFLCDYLTSITIPESVTKIGKSAFADCYYLTSVTIPESVTSIGERAFFYCESLTSITIPENVTSIGERAFFYCESLTSITIPENVTSIGDYAFAGCDSLTSITIPESVTSIGESAFYECSSLTSIDVALDNNNYTSIDGVLFSKDKNILIKYPNGKKDVTSYIIPDGVTEIGSSAFYRCRSLTSITIPESVTSIGFNAFNECYKLYEVYNKSDLAITAGSSKNGKVAYYAKNVYTDESGESKLKTVGDYIFYVDEDNIELLVYLGDEAAITLPSDYKGKNYKIGDYAFYDYRSLTSITLPKSVTEIGDHAFADCSSLTSITIPEGVTSIGKRAFSYCESLTSITIPEGVTEIEDEAFYGCHFLTSITLPESVTSIGEYAFSYCRSLTSITIPESVTEIGDEAFDGCKSLTSITSMNVTPPSIEYSDTFDGVDKSIPVYVPKQSVEAYKSAEYWKDFTNIQGIDDTPISDVVADSVSIRLIGNSLIVEGAESYAVYALSGQCLGMVESLERGVYIVVADGLSKKIVVK